jgi:hypothetical protein
MQKMMKKREKANSAIRTHMPRIVFEQGRPIVADFSSD